MGVVDSLLELPRCWASVLSATPAAGPAAAVSPTGVAVAILAALLVATVLSHWRHALGSIPIPRGTAVLPGGLPLLGHCIPALANFHRLHDWLLEGVQCVGEGRTFALSLPLLPTSFVVTDPACLEYVLKKRADTFIKGRTFAANFGALLGHGIFVADGPQWYWQRKLATNIFSVKSFKNYIETVFAEKMGSLVGVVGRAAASGQGLDLHDLMYRFTLDSFGQIGFGVDPGCLKTEGKVPFAAAFDSAQVIVNERFWLPGWQLLQFLNGDLLRLRRDVRTIKSFALDIITKRRQQLAADAAAAADAAGHDNSASSDEEGGAPRDLLSLFMASAGPDGKPLSMQQLIDTVINFIIAGRDTTAQALSWTFYLLMQHPEVEAALLQEARDVLGPAAAAGGAVLRPSYDQLRQLKLARAVFLEALRLYPSVPENAKFPVERDTLPDGTVVPAGAQVLYSAYVVNRLTRYWGPDAAQFRPERWLEMGKAPTPYNYLTFNAGPRICLGQRLAELEGVFVLTQLITSFSFRQVQPGARVDYNLSPTMPMKQGLTVYATARA